MLTPEEFRAKNMELFDKLPAMIAVRVLEETST